MKTRSLGVTAVATCSIAWLVVAASAQTKPVPGDAEAGRHLALLACTGCHLVAPTQPFKPVYVGSPHPPDFKDIANEPNLTPDSLLHHLQTLPVVPQKPGMANPDLTSEQLRDVVAFIFTLHGKAAAPGQ